jgi:hypothetical protein
MKARILNRKPIDYLFHHILAGFASSYGGLRGIFMDKVIDKDEYIELLEKNCERLIDRLKEFEIAQKLICLFFCCLFTYMQVNGAELERRGRSGGRRRNDTEMPEYLGDVEQ